MYKAAILFLSALFLTCSTAMASKSPETGLALKQQTLRSLDNLEAIVANAGLPATLLDAIESNRRAVGAMGPGDFASLPPVLKDQLQRVDTMTGDLKAAFQYRSDLRIIKSAGFPSADYPDVEWDFIIDALEEAPGGGSTSDASEGICNGTGYTANQTFAAMNGALVAEAIKDTAEQACNQSGIGFNASLACVVTDIAYFAAKGIFDNFNLCNDFVTAAEVNGNYRRLDHIHGDVQDLDADILNLDGDVAIVNADLASARAALLAAIAKHDGDMKSSLSTHDLDIKGSISQHDADLKNTLATHDADIKALLAGVQSGVNDNGARLEILLARQLEVIRLLHTPQGQRTSDVPACDGGPCRWNYARGQ